MDILILCLVLDDTTFKTGALSPSQKVSEFCLTYTNNTDCIILLIVYKQELTNLQQNFK